MKHLETVIIGAGPSGLQMGYFLAKAGRDYRILEANDTAGSFYAKYPRHRTLISNNKRYNGYSERDFNLRHDWNSLLSDDDDLLFRNYSADFFPHADDFCRYLHDFAARFQLAIDYNSRLEGVRKNAEGQFVLTVSGEDRYTCDRLLMATGAVSPRLPDDVEGAELADSYADHELDPDSYINQRVAIIGRGNSAFEVADHLSGTAAIIHMLVGTPVRHAWQTHYPGDLRAVNNNILDMYQLKSLHATVGFRPRKIEKNSDGTYTLTMDEDYPHWETPGTGTTTMVYDRVIHCTGWNYIEADIFAEDCRPELCPKGKLPQLGSDWQSSVPRLYFMGAAMQARDKKAASGFIHGYRYNVRTLFWLLEAKHHGVPLPQDVLPYQDENDLDALGQKLISRVSTTSGLFQLFGFLCDVIVFKEGKAQTIYELPREHIFEMPELSTAQDLVIVTLEYGFHKYPKNAATLDFIHPADASRPECSAYVHPVLRHYQHGEMIEELHLGESLVVRYDVYDYKENYDATHKNAIKNFLNRVNKISDITHSEQVYKDDSHVFRPWNEEEVRELEKKKQMYGDAECPFVI